MKRISILGLCLVAVTAFFALATTSAFAGEYGNCVKLKAVAKKYDGKYTNAECTVAATAKQIEEGKVNKYEWESAAGTTDKSSSKVATLKSETGEITCTKSKGTSEITGWESNKETTTFEDCTLSVTKGKCTGAGDKAGTIVSSADTFLIDHGTKGPSGDEPKEGEVWNEFQSTTGTGGLLAEFTCEPGVIFKTTATLSCPMSPVNAKPGKAAKLECAGKTGEQDLVTEFSENGGLSFESTGHNEEIVASTEKLNKDVEIRACNEPKCEHEEPVPW
jgi:hypothetical protein